MHIQFCGAAREVTGSAHLLTLPDGKKILLDCGLYQGRDEEMAEFNRSWPFDPAEIELLILSHAHIDHTGRVPKLVKDGFKGDIYCTHATRSLCALMLLDSARIQERDADYNSRHEDYVHEPLYTVADANAALERFVGLGYGRWHELRPGLRLLFSDAGHILGSASVALDIAQGGRSLKFGFSGDIGRYDRPILRDPQPMPEGLDYLIMESTYGDKEHEAPPQELDKLLHILRETCVERGGKLLIPAFSVGRTQELVFMLDQMENAGLLPKIPVYVDSPLAVNATQVFGNHPECYDEDLNEYLLTDPNPFGFNGLHYVRSVEHSKQLNASKKPAIIISASGMMNAGRVKHHLANMIDKPQNGILIVGYCAPYTPGGQLRDGATELTLFGQRKPVRAQVYQMDSFSAHADRLEMLRFIGNQRQLRRLFLVHGTHERQQHFAAFLRGHGFADIEIPSLSQGFDL